MKKDEYLTFDSVDEMIFSLKQHRYTFLESISCRWNRARFFMINAPRDFWYGIKNLLIWIEIMWNDRDWDWYFLMVILKKKLSLMESYHEKADTFVGTERETRRMKTCKNLIGRIIKDNYASSKQYKVLLSVNREKAFKWLDDHEAQDTELLFNQLKHFKKWWD